MKKKIVIAGLGETGLLTAVNLSHHKDYELIGITPKPCLLSGQELGIRITQPEVWKQNYVTEFSQYKKLSNVTIKQALVTAINPVDKTLTLQDEQGAEYSLDYDVLVIASGVSNGFWRYVNFDTREAMHGNIDNHYEQLKGAQHIAVVGGGPAGVSAAYNLKIHYPEKNIELFFSRDMPLPGYHPNVREDVLEKLKQAGVALYAGYRAELPEGFKGEELTSAAIEWSTGQAPVQADIVLWAIGSAKPNSSYLPAEMLDEKGFVKVSQHLQVQGYDNIFAVGDIAASDEFKSSARNWGFQLLGKNIHAYLSNKPLHTYKPTQYRWGSIIGVQHNGIEVYNPKGGKFRFPKWSINTILFPLFVRKMIYKGVTKK